MRQRPPWGGILGLASLVVGLLVCQPAQAYAWMIKHGFAKCGACHSDPSGGETLTVMGRVQADQLLSWGGGERPTPTAGFAFGAVPEPRDVRIGASYRHLFVYTAEYEGAPRTDANFPMQLDAYAAGHFDWFWLGGSLGVARGIEGTAHVRGAQINRELGDGVILLSRTHFVGVSLGDQSVLRIGRLNLPFGVRVPEHVLWVREATRTDRESDQQHGVALAHAAGPLRLEAMAIAGNFQLYPDRYRERGYSASIEYLVGDTVALGLSSLLTRSNEDRFTQAKRATRQAHGVTGRLGLSRELAILLEADLLKEGGRGLGYVGFVQSDYEPVQGLHLILTGEALDQGVLHGESLRAPGSGKPRGGAWVSLDLHLLSHFEVRLDLVKRQASAPTALLQLHVFL